MRGLRYGLALLALGLLGIPAHATGILDPQLAGPVASASCAMAGCAPATATAAWAQRQAKRKNWHKRLNCRGKKSHKRRCHYVEPDELLPGAGPPAAILPPPAYTPPAASNPLPPVELTRTPPTAPAVIDVPEPATLALFGLGLLGLALGRRR